MIVYITELNDTNFDEFTNHPLTLVDVWAPWCEPCKLVAPIIDQISSEYVGQLSVGKLNADENSDLVKKLGIRNIPTIIFYKEGELLTDSEGNTVKIVGNVSKDRLKQVINEYLY